MKKDAYGTSGSKQIFKSNLNASDFFSHFRFNLFVESFWSRRLQQLAVKVGQPIPQIDFSQYKTEQLLVGWAVCLSVCLSVFLSGPGVYDGGGAAAICLVLSFPREYDQYMCTS